MRLHILLANDCLDRHSQYGPFFVQIQLAVDHAKKILFIVQCNLAVKPLGC